MKTSIYLILTIFTLFSCSQKSDKKNADHTDSDENTEVAKTKKIEKVYPSDSKFDAIASFLAGQDSKNGEFSDLEQMNSFTAFQSNMDQLWKKTNEKLPVIKDWTTNELEDVNKLGGTLFYPFSGADFLHVNLFFPEYDTIVMFALEPIGSLPDLKQKQKDTTLDNYLNQLKKSMNAILGLSFFRTIAMADDFKSELDGTLPLFMHFMKRTGHEVMYQEKVAIQPDGSITNDLSNKADSTYIGNRYYLKKQGEEKVKTLYYFAVNIQNSPYVSRGGLVAKGLETRKDLLTFLNKRDVNATYLKSASYLLHRPTFSIIRDFILDNSDYLLQDDSGVPVEYFDPVTWDLTFYGSYIKPISLFAERHQEALAEIYKEGKNVKPLPFGIGYQYHKGSSNMMLAKKRKANED